MGERACSVARVLAWRARRRYPRFRRAARTGAQRGQPRGTSAPSVDPRRQRTNRLLRRRGGRGEHLVLLAREDVDARDVGLGGAVLARLGGGVVDDLAGEALDDDVAALLDRTDRDRRAAGGTCNTHRHVEEGCGEGSKGEQRGGQAKASAAGGKEGFRNWERSVCVCVGFLTHRRPSPRTPHQTSCGGFESRETAGREEGGRGARQGAGRMGRGLR